MSATGRLRREGPDLLTVDTHSGTVVNRLSPDAGQALSVVALSETRVTVWSGSSVSTYGLADLGPPWGISTSVPSPTRSPSATRSSSPGSVAVCSPGAIPWSPDTTDIVRSATATVGAGDPRPLELAGHSSSRRGCGLATAELLVDAALEAIAEVGLASATVEEISRCAGVTQGALFHHFATPPCLLVAAIARHDAGFGQRYEAALRTVDGDSTRMDPEPVAQLAPRQCAQLRRYRLAELLVGACTDPEMYGDVTRRITSHWSAIRVLITRHSALDAVAPAALDIWLDIVEDFLAGEMIWALADRGRGPAEPTNADKVATLVELAGVIDPQLVPEEPS